MFSPTSVIGRVGYLGRNILLNIYLFTTMLICISLFDAQEIGLGSTFLIFGAILPWLIGYIYIGNQRLNHINSESLNRLWRVCWLFQFANIAITVIFAGFIFLAFLNGHVNIHNDVGDITSPIPHGVIGVLKFISYIITVIYWICIFALFFIFPCIFIFKKGEGV